MASETSPRLYYDDPALLAFDATVTACAPVGEKWRVQLDRSAFYPSSGGQPHDIGHLHVDGRAIAVTNVEVDEDDFVWHQVAQSLTPGTVVRGDVDGMRRRDFRQQHSGQHILSAAFDSLVDARTESVHLGLEACTLDLHRDVTPDECLRAESLANDVVWDDRQVSIRYADAANLVDEPRLRKATGREGRVRLIDIEGHDLSACGGTHVHRTGEVGIIVVRGTERFRGGTRVTFLCGRRALESHRLLRETLDASARALSVAPHDVPAALVRMRQSLDDVQRRAKGLGEQLVALQATSLESGIDTEGRLVALLPDADAASARVAALQLIAASGRVVALLAGSLPHALVIARSADRTDVDAGAIVRAICAAHGGKGGGRPDLAQAGGVAVTVDALRAFL